LAGGACAVTGAIFVAVDVVVAVSAADITGTNPGTVTNPGKTGIFVVPDGKCGVMLTRGGSLLSFSSTTSPDAAAEAEAPKTPAKLDPAAVGVFKEGSHTEVEPKEAGPGPECVALVEAADAVAVVVAEDAVVGVVKEQEEIKDGIDGPVNEEEEEERDRQSG